MTERRETYLGDGLYASHDGYQFILRAPRGAGISDYVFLEPSVLQSFLDFVGKITNSEVSVTPLNQET